MTDAEWQATRANTLHVLAEARRESQPISEASARSPEVREQAVRVLRRARYRVS
jgi:hypothetical protein